MFNSPILRPDQHLIFLDHLRGIAILMVFGFHCLGASYGMDALKWDGWFRSFTAHRSFLALLPLTMGWSGVSVFFVISGFCIHYSYSRSVHRDFKSFFIRRFFRIYPPYLAATVFFAFLVPFTRMPIDSDEIWRQLFSHLALIHNLHIETFAGINPSFWSIGVEAQLYLLYPLLLSLQRRIGWRGTLWVTAAIEIALRGTRGIMDMLPADPFPKLFLLSGPFYFWFSWTIGAKLADDWLHGTYTSLGWFPWWGWAFLAWAAYFIKPLFPFCFLLVALATARAIVVLLRKPADQWPGPSFLLRHLRRVGLSSYSLYLLHQPLLGIVPWLIPMIFPNLHLHAYRQFLFCVVLYFPLLLFSHNFARFLEYPSNALGKKIAAGKTTPVSSNP